MNIKEFNKKKQEVIDTILDRYGRDTILARIKELQPPTPPICSTCKYFEDDGVHWAKCNAWRKNQAISDMADNDISDPEDMGCIHHSDYGVEDGS